MRMSLLFLLVVLCLSATPSRAQSAPVVEHHPQAQLDEELAGAATAPERTAVKVLGDNGRYRYVVLRRDRTGEVEVHDAWDDVIVVRSGAAMLLHGGAISGGRQTAPGETRGGVISGGVAQPIAAGDIVVVPAGIPHQVQVAPGGTVTYLVVKAPPAPDAPHHWTPAPRPELRSPNTNHPESPGAPSP